MSYHDPICAGLDIYLVGGAVRDELLGLTVHDHDYVVVGATPEEMMKRGFLPVGQDFPVFLHPHSHEEYALARTERKTATGYKGFSCYSAADVTLEQDLSRRDLTINAIAKAANASLIDPYHGVADLRAGILRHVSPAFAEDPVRILRTARFAARYASNPRPFTIADETLLLMKQMVTAGEVDALVPERVWQEFAKGLMEQHPGRMLEVLASCTALPRLLPDALALSITSSPHEADQQIQQLADLLNLAAGANFTLNQRFAFLLYGLLQPALLHPGQTGHQQHHVQQAQQTCQHLRCPAEARDLALLYLRLAQNLWPNTSLSAAIMVDSFSAADAWRRPQRMLELIQLAEIHSQFFAAAGNCSALDLTIWRRAFSAAQTIKGGAVAAQFANQADAATLIPVALRQARIAAILATMQTELPA